MVKKEIWKSVHLEEFKDVYKVSSLGRVKNINTKNILSLNSTRSGYISIWLSYKGYKKAVKVHILVANAFLEKPVDKKQININHIDGNKLNNRADNLE